ncbi:MAG: hypothetical protein M1816_007846 [Peltula sp. TS41687]|nr:MAG: hypothetical protein M1816_007846 [Peltula sp. TS41687]
MSQQPPPLLSPSTTKRLLHELHAYNQQQSQPTTSSHTSSTSHHLTHLSPTSEADLSQWTATLLGPRGTPYEGGRWELAIRFPPNYPLHPPAVTFVTRICHPNVNFHTGEICLDLLSADEAWTPAYTIVQTLGAVHMLLAEPGLDSPLNVDVAGLWRAGDRVAAEALVRFYTGEFAGVG